MFIDKVTLEAMLRAYQDELINDLVYYKDNFTHYIDEIKDAENEVKAIDRVINGKEKLVIDKDLDFK